MRQGIIHFHAVLMALMTLAGCQYIQTGSSVSGQSAKSCLYDVAVPKDFQNEIRSVAAGTVVYSTGPEKARVYLRLVLLYSHYKNPSPDYGKALDALNKYIDLDPVGAKRDEVLQIKHYLSTITAAQKENGKLESTVTQLKNDVDEMKESIEKLKSLDVMMEEKRKQVK